MSMRKERGEVYADHPYLILYMVTITGTLPLSLERVLATRLHNDNPETRS